MVPVQWQAPLLLIATAVVAVATIALSNGHWSWPAWLAAFLAETVAYGGLFKGLFQPSAWRSYASSLNGFGWAWFAAITALPGLVVATLASGVGFALGHIWT